MNKPYDIIVVIGRFQPLHNAHLELFEKSGKLAHKVIIIIGSAYAPRSPKNPWTADERYNMIRAVLRRSSKIIDSKFSIEYNIDTLYDDDGWIARVQNIVGRYSNPGDRIALLGYKKDADTARYLSMFPQWEYISHEAVEILNATDIRNLYFSDNYTQSWLTGVVPTPVLASLEQFKNTPEYQYILEEKRVIDAVVAEKSAYKYPIIAVTVDSVVVQSGHILLITRKSSPGKGLWALPGGYFDAEQDCEPLDGIIRELKEETCIDVPEKVLRGSVKEIRRFSAKGRSQLGRSITFAAHISLREGEWKLPRVKGSDDASVARWIPFVDVKREHLFDDHYDIISNFVPLVK
jgi:bifunctional NMN adenylyltransferase/nudix hydrolase